MLKVLLIDDEPLAHENLKFLLQAYSDINVIGECANAIDGIKYIHNLKPDVIFLDIEMPKINGIEMLAMIDPDIMPYIVFVTAYNHYAIQAFENNAVDYILKPIEKKRLQKTLERLRSKLPSQNIEKIIDKAELKYIPCVGHKKIYLINIQDIYYISSHIGGISVFTEDGHEYITDMLLKVIEARTNLIRCHRQYLINSAYLKELRVDDNEKTNLILKNNVAVPVSRRHLKELKEKLGFFF